MLSAHFPPTAQPPYYAMPKKKQKLRRRPVVQIARRRAAKRELRDWEVEHGADFGEWIDGYFRDIYARMGLDPSQKSPPTHGECAVCARLYRIGRGVAFMGQAICRRCAFRLMGVRHWD